MATRVMRIEHESREVEVRLSLEITSDGTPTGGKASVMAKLAFERPSKPIRERDLKFSVDGMGKGVWPTTDDGNVRQVFDGLDFGSHEVMVEVIDTGLFVVERCTFPRPNPKERAAQEAEADLRLLKAQRELDAMEERPADIKAWVAQDVIYCQVLSNKERGITGDVVVVQQARGYAKDVVIGADGKGERQVDTDKNRSIEYTVMLRQPFKEVKVTVAAMPKRRVSLREEFRRIWGTHNNP